MADSDKIERAIELGAAIAASRQEAERRRRQAKIEENKALSAETHVNQMEAELRLILGQDQVKALRTIGQPQAVNPVKKRPELVEGSMAWQIVEEMRSKAGKSYNALGIADSLGLPYSASLRSTLIRLHATGWLEKPMRGEYCYPKGKHDEKCEEGKI